MSGKQAAYAGKRRALTGPQLRAWVADMLTLGEVATPTEFNCQQDQTMCACYEGANRSGVGCGCVAADARALGQTFDPAGSIHEPGPLRDAWMAGRDAAAYAALRASVDGACGLVIACRAALVMPQADEVEL